MWISFKPLLDVVQIQSSDMLKVDMLPSEWHSMKVHLSLTNVALNAVDDIAKAP